MASSDLRLVRDNSRDTQQYLLNTQFLSNGCSGRVRLQDSMCDKPGPSSPLMSTALPLLANHIYGTISSPATLLDSPIQTELSTDPPTAFSEQEDDILRELVKRHGTKKWHIISSKMQKKTPRECRKSWSAEEDHLLLQGHNAFGNRWTEIAKMVPGRTDNAVKNRYNALCTKRSHSTLKAGNGYNAASTGRIHHIEEAWNEANAYWHGHDSKRTKRRNQDDDEDDDGRRRRFFGAQATNMACLKSNHIISETSCSPLDFTIDEMPQANFDLHRMRMLRKQVGGGNHASDSRSLLEGILPASVDDSATSPRDGPVDMDEVMGWLLTSAQTPTPTIDCSADSVHPSVSSCGRMKSPSAILRVDAELDAELELSDIKEP
ncbi:uncharacterized protein [Physcomitrium patens]|uniref:uncharacterized protein isoform X3 n=1 Tax=Physcomitrium patens TaxID=3218 RepID=UPI000D163780|nr:transcription factor MYB3R-5-like isoform X2 [Physcomitrium patens]|eukprot:XP_024400444.1 transcription factor MYB3R-5-like isoform X2 [Physcomitrella patens]